MKLSDAHVPVRFLVSEYLSGLLLRAMALPCPRPVVVEVSSTVGFSDKLDAGVRSRVQQIVAAGPQLAFGSEYHPDHEERGADLTQDAIANWDVVLGAVVFDTWVFNRDARQFLGKKTNGCWKLMLFDNDGAFDRDWQLEARTVVAATRSPARSTSSSRISSSPRGPRHSTSTSASLRSRSLERRSPGWLTSCPLRGGRCLTMA